MIFVFLIICKSYALSNIIDFTSDNFKEDVLNSDGSYFISLHFLRIKILIYFFNILLLLKSVFWSDLSYMS